MSYSIIQADAAYIPLADRSVDLVMGSPPYVTCRTYDDGTLPAGYVCSREPEAWIEWMMDVTVEALRVSRGAVIWVVGCPTRDRNYQPAAEGLMYEAYRRGIHQYRPVAWIKTNHDDSGCGTPGSGGDDWFRADWEYCIAFKRPGPLPWSDNTAMGKPPAYGQGGEFSNRLVNGGRVNDPWGKKGRGNGISGRNRDGSKRVGKPHSKRLLGGAMEIQTYVPPKLSNPGNIVRARVGGGHLGDDLAHDNDAPYPEGVPEFFVRSICPIGGVVLDVFGGSGTTGAAAIKHDRRAICMDLRGSQVTLMRRRLGKALKPSTFQDLHAQVDAPLFAKGAA